MRSAALRALKHQLHPFELDDTTARFQRLDDSDRVRQQLRVHGSHDAHEPPIADASTVTTTNGVQLRGHSLLSKSPAGTLFMVTCFERVDGKDPEGMVEQTLDGVRRSYPDATIAAFSQGAVRGQAFEAHDSRDRWYTGRAFLASGQACQVTAFRQGAPSDKDTTEIRKSLESFRPRKLQKK